MWSMSRIRGKIRCAISSRHQPCFVKRVWSPQFTSLSCPVKLTRWLVNTNNFSSVTGRESEAAKNENVHANVDILVTMMNSSVRSVEEPTLPGILRLDATHWQNVRIGKNIFDEIKMAEKIVQRCAQSNRSLSAVEMDFVYHVLTHCKNQELCSKVLPLVQYLSSHDEPCGDAKTYDEWIRIYHTLSLHRDVKRIYETKIKLYDIKMNQLEPKSWGLVLQSYGHLKEYEKAYAFYETCKQNHNRIDNQKEASNNVFLDETMLAICSKAARVDWAERIFLNVKSNKNKHAQPSYPMYVGLVGAYAKKGKINLAFEALNEYKRKSKNGLKNVRQGTSEDLSALYSAIILHYKGTDAIAFFDKIDSTLKPHIDVAIYNSVIDACAELGKLDLAFSIYEEMKAYQVSPTLKTHFFMLKACKQAKKHVPSVNTRYNILGLGMGVAGISSLAIWEMMSSTHQHLVVMGASLVLVSATLNRGSSRLSRDMEDWFKHWQKNDPLMAFFRRVSEENHVDRALYIWQEMCCQGLKPDHACYRMLVEVCDRKLRPQAASRILLNHHRHDHLIHRFHQATEVNDAFNPKTRKRKNMKASTKMNTNVAAPAAVAPAAVAPDAVAPDALPDAILDAATSSNSNSNAIPISGDVVNLLITSLTTNGYDTSAQQVFRFAVANDLWKGFLTSTSDVHEYNMKRLSCDASSVGIICILGDFTRRELGSVDLHQLKPTLRFQLKNAPLVLKKLENAFSRTALNRTSIPMTLNVSGLLFHVGISKDVLSLKQVSLS